MQKFIYIILIIVLNYSSNLFAQEKFEKESRIQPKDVPSKALLFIDSLNIKNKVKWYLEEGLSRKSVEAKFKYKKAKYSVEFDILGNIEDIEIEVKWAALTPSIKDSISRKLKTDCVKHKIVKVQKQYSGSESNLLSILKTDLNTTLFTINYELIISCKQQKKVDLFEYLFNEEGSLISTSKIVFKNSSHLEY